MLVGCNHTIIVEGLTYHILTEDLGLDNPVIVTQVFQAGALIAVRKNSYSAQQPATEIAQQMQDQHQAMLNFLQQQKLSTAETIPNPAPFVTTTAKPNTLQFTTVPPNTTATTAAAEKQPVAVEERFLSDAILEFLRTKT